MTQGRILSYRFKEFRLNVADLTLFRGGEVITLTQKTVQLLSVLVTRHGQVVGKAELLEQVWPGVHVTHANLTQNIYLLRKILGSEAIITEPKRGYRFALEVESEVEEVFKEGPDEAVIKWPDAAAFNNPSVEESNDPRKDSSVQARPRDKRTYRRGFAKRRAVTFGLSVVILTLSVSLYQWINKAVVPRESHQNWPRNSIAVLPFRTIGGVGGQDYFGLGISDVIITKLSGLRRLSVRPTSAIFRYTERAVDPTEAGRELMVDSVLEGSVQNADGQIRVSVRLIRVSDGQPIWAGVFDERVENIFSVQDAIAERVTSRLYSNLTEDEREVLAKRQTNSLEAYEAYVQGLYYCSKRTKEGLGKSVNYFTGAIAKDSNYTLAYAGLADAYALIAIWEYDLFPQKEAFERAKALAARALELDESLAEAHAVLAILRHMYEDDSEEAEKEFKRAIELDPNNASIHHKYGVFLQDTLNIDGSYAELRLAQQLDPRSMQINLNLCYVTYLFGRYEEAYGYCQNAREYGPTHPRINLGMGLIELERKRYGKAIELFTAVKSELPSYWLGSLGYAYAKEGRESDARDLLASLEVVQGPPHGGQQYAKSVIYAGLGDARRALRSLKSERKDWSPLCVHIKYDPQLASIRSSSGFGPLLKYCDKRFQY
jgi:TolB-like protein/DNA-binding winged helix-turn-helix (wHTH) protein/Tfp pilus assembly protein PilF